MLLWDNIDHFYLSEIFNIFVGAPAYLSVSGYKLCLEVFTPNGASHTELCLPQKRADSCVEESWNQLKKVFEGDCPQKGKNPFFSIDYIFLEKQNREILIVS